jgi:hypothetical protein
VEENTALALPGQVENVFLSARNSKEMAESQSKLAGWLQGKMNSCETEATNLRKAADHAKKMKWNHKNLLAAFSREMRRVVYYEKLLKAVQAGYVLIPWNWMDVFAVRVKRDSPRTTFAESNERKNAINRLPDARPDNLRAGEGRYVADNVMGKATRYSELKDGKEVVKWSAYPTDFMDVEFPLAAAKPELMNATANAMALKIFDEIGVSPARSGKDPLIIGSIRGPQYKKQFFLIAWYLDTRAL